MVLTTDILLSYDVKYIFSIFNNQGQALTPYVPSYIDAGVKYIGGCCNVNPNEIGAMRHAIDEYVSKKKP